MVQVARNQLHEANPFQDYYGTRNIGPEDMDQLLDNHYEESGLDKNITAPLPETVNRLELTDVHF